MEYRIARPEDREKVIDFANYVFSQAHRPHDFKTLIPKEYSDRVPGAAAHYIAVREDGAIRAMTANLPVSMRFGDQILKTGMVGTVSVHPYARGEGHMKVLMQMLLDDAEKRGFDLLALGGLRQRYGYFGFEGGCAAAAYEITETNVRHALKNVDDSSIAFETLAKEDCEGVDFAWKLANARKMGGVRPRDAFWEIMHNWNRPMRLICAEKKSIGYVMGGMGGNIAELALENEGDLFRVLKALFRADGAQAFSIDVAPCEIERADQLGKIAENVRIVPQERIRVLHWERVLAATLNLKAEYANLQDGKLVLRIGDKNYRLSVQGGKADVQITEDAPDRVYTELQAVRKLFGVESALFREGGDYNWLPLPMFFSGADTF